MTANSWSADLLCLTEFCRRYAIGGNVIKIEISPKIDKRIFSLYRFSPEWSGIYSESLFQNHSG